MVAAQLNTTGARPTKDLPGPGRSGAGPGGRGTAPALTLAAVHSVTADDPVLLAMPSDHVVLDTGNFQRAVERGAALARQGYIVTFGVPPTSPETGYGYIRSGNALPGTQDVEARYVDAFVQKPDAAP